MKPTEVARRRKKKKVPFSKRIDTKADIQRITHDCQKDAREW